MNDSRNAHSTDINLVHIQNFLKKKKTWNKISGFNNIKTLCSAVLLMF
jgi:hypothetical protein